MNSSISGKIKARELQGKSLLAEVVLRTHAQVGELAYPHGLGPCVCGFESHLVYQLRRIQQILKNKINKNIVLEFLKSIKPSVVSMRLVINYNMSYSKSEKNKKKLKKLAQETYNTCPTGAFYSEKKKRYVRYYRGNNWLKVHCRRMTRRKLKNTTVIYDKSQYKKLYDYWWELY